MTSSAAPLDPEYISLPPIPSVSRYPQIHSTLSYALSEVIRTQVQFQSMFMTASHTTAVPTMLVVIVSNGSR